MLNHVQTYFIGKAGVTPQTWSIQGTFIWTLHVDSMGFPGPLLYASVTSPIGDSAALQYGGFYRQSLQWWLPDSLNSGSWLVGSWPSTARNVVRLGADALPCPAELLIGYADNGTVQWVPYPDNGLLIRAEILYSEPSANPSGDTGDGFTIIRNLVAGPMSPRADTLVHPAGASLIWHDSTALTGQTLSYSIGPVCPGGGDAAAVTPEVVIPQRWAAEFSPSILAFEVHSVTDTLRQVSLTNPGADPLAVSIPPATLAFEAQRFESSSPTAVLYASPDTFNLAAGGTRTFNLDIPVSDLPAGSYSAWLIAGLRALTSDSAERHAIPVSLSVDVTTSISDTDSHESQPVTGHPVSSVLDVTASPNPFAETVTLTWAIPGAVAPASVISQSYMGGLPQGEAEVIVYNLLGHKMKRELIDVKLEGEPETASASVTIAGTQAWPSGVYLVSVRYQGRANTVKLLHLK